MGFICAEVSLQYGDGMWLQLTLGHGELKVFVSSPLFLQKADKTGLWRKKLTKCDALQTKDAYCDRSSMKNSERTLARGFISALVNFLLLRFHNINSQNHITETIQT